jgi:hypothetical protein
VKTERKKETKTQHHHLLLICSASVTLTLFPCVRILWTHPLSPISDPLLIQFLSHNNLIIVFNSLLINFWYFFSLSLYLSINFFLLFFSFLLIIIFFQKFKRLGLVKNRLIARSTSSGSDQSDAGGSLNGIQLTPNKLFLQEVTVLFYSFFCFKLC